MAIIGANKPTLLKQIQRQPTVDLQTLVKLIHQYEDLAIEDFRGYVSDVLLEQLKEAGRDPKEVELWNQIVSTPRDTIEKIQEVQRLVVTYLNKYPAGSKVGDANDILRKLPIEIEIIREEDEWKKLERGNYSALANYKMRHPNSPHMDELDDLMWTNTRNVMNQHSLNRYLNDWPLGRHAEEATRALNSFAEWHPDSPFITEVNSTYYKLRDEKLAEMKKNPSEFSKDDVERLIAADIFTQWQLIDEGLVTDESWETLQLDRDLFPNIQDYQHEDPNIQAPANCTDIYLFGTPGTGKTCLLMGLTGANGEGYTLNMKIQGGPYAAALQQYVNAGITPGRTFGSFVTTINGQVNETTRGGNIINHRINLVEMSGEEFALRIADNQAVAFDNMGVGSANLLTNTNRKVFFIIVDATKAKTPVKVEYVEKIRDAEGNVIDERIRKKYISQLNILSKFVGLFELPENQEIMKRVDAIHFVVTKADMLGDGANRLERARTLLQETYLGPVETLKAYCRQTKRINYSTGYKPQVFTFSLGQFFLGDVFKFDKSETIKIVETIRTVTGGVREKSFWDRLKDALN